MKQRVMKAFCLSLVLAGLIAPAVFADDQTINLESVIIQTFDEPTEQPWFVIGSKFAAKAYPKIAYVKAWPVSVFGTSEANQGKNMHSMGLALLFDRKEYNWVDVIPGVKKGQGEDVTYEPKELTLPGRVRMVDLWIWSGNFNYYLEAYVRDFTGVVHILPMGTLNHVGWKNFRVNIPNNIPQSKKYLPRREGLRLVKFRIWTRPTEVVAIPAGADAKDYQKAVYFYFDQLKVLTDTFETLYDGDSLANPDLVKENWDTSSNSD